MKNDFKIEDFGPYKLSSGSHDSPKDGMCVMEMVSFLEGEEWSDRPKCTCPVIAEFCRTINDEMPQNYRDKLQLRVLKLVGTNNPSLEQERAEFLAWQAIKVYAPVYLEAKGFHKAAQELLNFDTGKGLLAAYDAADAAYAAVHTDDDVAYSSAYSADAHNTAYSAAAHAAACYAADAYSAAYSASYHAAYAASLAAVYVYADSVWDRVLITLDNLIDIGSSENIQKITDSRADNLSKLKDLVAA